MSALLGALIGAFAVFGASVLAEAYRRHRDRQGVASAIAGEMAGILDMAQKRKHADYFEKRVLPQLDRGEDVKIPKFFAGSLEFKERYPVMDRYLDRLGHLPVDTPERIVRFYQYVSGIRLDIDRLTAGEFDYDLKVKANVVRENLELWRTDAVPLGGELIRELRETARAPFSLSECGVSLPQLPALFRRQA